MKTKICTACKEEKELDQFYRDKTGKYGRRARCKTCSAGFKEKYLADTKENRNSYMREYYRSNPGVRERASARRDSFFRAWMAIIKETFGGSACSRCGYDKCWSAMDFHHKTGAEKKYLVSHLLRRKPTDERIKELDTVVLLCSNCHREVHYEENYE